MTFAGRIRHDLLSAQLSQLLSARLSQLVGAPLSHCKPRSRTDCRTRSLTAGASNHIQTLAVLFLEHGFEFPQGDTSCSIFQQSSNVTVTFLQWLASIPEPK